MKRSRTCNDLTQLLQSHEECSNTPSFPMKKSRTFENIELLEREIREVHLQRESISSNCSKYQSPSCYQEIFEETKNSLLFDASYYAKCQLLNDEDIGVDEMKYLPDLQISRLCFHFSKQLSTSRPSCA